MLLFLFAKGKLPADIINNVVNGIAYYERIQNQSDHNNLR